jgi:hypothetical protein
MANWKVEALFSLPGGGSYAETYYTTCETTTIAQGRIGAYAIWRRSYIANGVIIKGYRVGKLLEPGSGTSQQLNLGRAGLTTALYNRDLRTVGARVKLRDEAGTWTTSRIIRGLPDDWFDWTTTGAFIENAELNEFLLAYVAKLKEHSLGSQRLSRNPLFTLPTRIEDFTISPGGVVISFTSLGAVYAAGSKVNIKGAKGLGTRRLNGTYSVTTSSAGVPAVTGVSSRLVGQLLYRANSAQAYHRIYEYLIPDNINFQEVSSRKVSPKAFFVPAGRRSVR